MKKPKKIKYEPISVRDSLIEMKNLSELMIDLAYSAALFNSRELAEDVLELEERVDILTYLLNMTAMLATRDAEDAEALAGVNAVATAVNKISDAAADIATIVLKNIAIHPLVREVFEKAEESLGRAVVKAGSVLIGKKLKDLNLVAEIGVDVTVIRRGKDWIINPGEEEMIKEGDILFTRGPHSSIERLKGLAEASIMKVEWE